MFKEIMQGQKRSLVHDAIEEVIQMIEKAESMFSISCDTLLNNKPTADITREDEDINTGERVVRRILFQHLMVNPSQDLPVSISVLSIVHDVERIGDYAKSLLELNQWGALCNPDSRYGEICRELQGMIKPLFGQAIQAMRDGDVDAARQLMQCHVEIKKRTDDFMRLAMEDSGADRDTVLHCLAARYLRRVSGHLSNVASSLVNPLDQLAATAAE